MALEREIYKALEQIVGAKNISEDPGVCETYRCAAAQSSAHYGPYDHRTPMPQAVLMPGSTEEVQGILRICNKYKLKYKASTTFWSAHGYIGTDYAIQLDMRRMKKIEIDSRNMIATIEPYAIAATVQAEAMKHGLTCNIPGVGCSSSILANTSGWGGPGPSSVFTGMAYENLICLEWVLPNGEILVSGSAGANAGWFHGDGPGPSVRAVLRGASGTCGEMGVCTKMSIKLSPWPGPTYLPSEGVSGVYRAKLPDNFKAYVLCFPSWKAWAEAIMKINDNNILYIGHRQFSMFGCDIKAAMLEILTDPDKQLADIPVLNQDPEIQKANKSMNIEVHVVIAGMSDLDMAWKEKALDQILAEYDGWKDEMMLRPEMANYLLTYFIRLGHKNLNYVMCGSYEGHFGLNANNIIHSASIVEDAIALKLESEATGTYNAKVGGDTVMGSIGAIGGGGGPMGWEFFAHFDAHDKESIKGTEAYFKRVAVPFMQGIGREMGTSNEQRRRPDGYAYTQEEQNKMFAGLPGTNTFLYQWYIREAFNPNHLGDSYYETVDPEAIAALAASKK